MMTWYTGQDRDHPEAVTWAEPFHTDPRICLNQSSHCGNPTSSRHWQNDLKLERRRPKNCRRSSILLPHTRPVGFHLIITSCLPLLIAFLILCFPPLSSLKVKGVKIQRLAVVGGWVPANQAQLFALVESDNVLTY